MFPNLKYDFRRVYHKTSYKGKFRKAFVTLWSQGFQAMVGYRMCRWMVSKRIPVLNIFIQRLVEVFTGISIPPTVDIGKGLMIEHFGGIVINSGSKIGDFCTISHEVTLGNKKPGGKAPILGNYVYVCVGAKVLGDITVGDNCIIGANAVLMTSIPANSIVAGIPARIVRQFDPDKEYKEFREMI
jgi:serine O-acetyltransferase